MQKTFLIVNLSFFGDVLLTNPLCQNLKTEYPDCKIVFLTNKPFVEVAKYQKDVDDAIFLDKRKENKGFLGLIKFAYHCKYRNKIDVAFVVYGNPRGIIVSRLLGAKRVVAKPPKFIKFLVSDIPTGREPIKAQDINGHLFEGYAKKAEKVLPIKYLTNPKESFIAKKIRENYPNSTLIGLCCTSKCKSKDMLLEHAIEIINNLHTKGKTVLFFGSGQIARNYADNIKKHGCTNFVDLTNITSIYDLANLLSVCEKLISVDTGTMHLGYAVSCPTVCVFYQNGPSKKWAPDEKLYNVKIIENDITPEKIIESMDKLPKKTLG